MTQGRNGTAAAVFAQKLRREMVAQGLTVRGLGRKMDPSDPERGRRRVQRHLSGKHLPSGPSRAAYAAALGIPREQLEPEDDDSEGQPAMDLDVRLTQAIREMKAMLAEVRRNKVRDSGKKEAAA